MLTTIAAAVAAAGGHTSAWSARSLHALALDGSGVSGSLPGAWGEPGSMLGASLSELYLHKTSINGSIPDSWLAGLGNITRFTVWSSNVCGPLPHEAASSSNLTSFTLGMLCVDDSLTRLGVC
jgi:hypothetical protein